MVVFIGNGQRLVAPRTRMADIVFDTLRRNLVFIDKILGDLVAVFHFIHD